MLKWIRIGEKNSIGVALVHFKGDSVFKFEVKDLTDPRTDGTFFDYASDIDDLIAILKKAKHERDKEHKVLMMEEQGQEQKARKEGAK